MQSFPGDFIFSGSITSQFRQIGNAVPPHLAKVLGKQASMIKAQVRVKKNEMKKDFMKKAFTYSELTYAS